MAWGRAMDGLTKYEQLRDASDKLRQQARIERAEAERVRAGARKARDLAKHQLSRMKERRLRGLLPAFP